MLYANFCGVHSSGAGLSQEPVCELQSMEAKPSGPRQPFLGRPLVVDSKSAPLSGPLPVSSL